MQLGHIELFVGDALAARRFYTRVLGFELVMEQGEAFTWLKSGGTELLLRPGNPESTPAGYTVAPVGFVLYTSDLSAELERLAELGVSCQAMPGEPDCYVFSDLDGHWFQLVNPGEHVG
jgi:catechol 2,3-dioxygenase-like lactoylglutathione lyase family enzyme